MHCHTREKECVYLANTTTVTITLPIPHSMSNPTRKLARKVHQDHVGICSEDVAGC